MAAGQRRRFVSRVLYYARRTPSGVVGLLLSAGCLAIMVAIVYVFGIRPNDISGFMSPAQFEQLQVGETRRAVEASVGGPSHDAWPVGVTSWASPGQSCVFYTETDAIMDPDVYELCYTADRLTLIVDYLDGRQPQVVASAR